MASVAQNEPRRLSKTLLMGILAFPVIFAWFLLRNGYSNTLRVGAFLYLGITLALGIVKAAGW
jgi:hypothetical protein